MVHGNRSRRDGCTHPLFQRQRCRGPRKRSGPDCTRWRGGWKIQTGVCAWIIQCHTCESALHAYRNRVRGSECGSTVSTGERGGERALKSATRIPPMAIPNGREGREEGEAAMSSHRAKRRLMGETEGQVVVAAGGGRGRIHLKTADTLRSIGWQVSQAYRW